jgi:hypothetical protein
MVGKAQKLHGTRYELNSVFGLEKVDQWNPIRTSAIQSSMFLGSGWSIVKSALLAEAGTSKKRPSLHLHKVLTQSNKASP